MGILDKLGILISEADGVDGGGVDDSIPTTDTEQDDKIIKLFFNDLTPEGQKKIFDGIDNSFDYVDVFEDSIVRDNIEQALSTKPFLIMNGEEIVKKYNITM